MKEKKEEQAANVAAWFEDIVLASGTPENQFKMASRKVRVLTDKGLQCSSKTEYIYACRGSVVGAPANVRYAAGQYVGHSQGTH